jgi:hypothetical protein
MIMCMRMCIWIWKGMCNACWDDWMDVDWYVHLYLYVYLDDYVDAYMDGLVFVCGY